MSKEQTKAELIFDRWKADLKEMDRSRHKVEGNFELLFVTLDESKISFETAHQILDKAIKAHYPSQSVVDRTYRRLKPVVSKSKDEFHEEWKDNISAAAKRAFYGLFNIDGAAEKQEDKEYGSMSASEYRKQRKYADSYPTLDWTKIKIEPMSPEDLEINLTDLELDNE